MAEVPIDWPKLIDETLLAGLTRFAVERPELVDTVYLTGSYVLGTWNPGRPNVNVYFIAAAGVAEQVRLDLSRVLHDIRGKLRAEGVELVLDCHPFTISERDPSWLYRPLLTLTTKVFAGELAAERYHVPPTLGRHWFVAHRILHGRADALQVFGPPPPRDRHWLSAVHQTLSHYRSLLDHLPWALDWQDHPSRLVEESARYAEEALKDGVQLAVSEEELAAGRHVDVLHGWKQLGREFYRHHYGERGTAAYDNVDRLKAASIADDPAPADAEAAWREALGVWSLVWEQYRRLAFRMGAGPELLRVEAFL